MVRFNCKRVVIVVLVLCALVVFLHIKHTPLQEDPIIYSGAIVIEPSTVSNDPVDAMIDWRNHILEEQEASRKGLGEHGTGVSLNESEKALVPALMNVNGFNAVASDKISLHRAMKELRLEICQTLKYNSNLPQASIIIPFHDEHWSTLLRTVHSLSSRAPARLIHEIILVDDNSTKIFLGDQLDQYVKKTFDNVRVIRTTRREGLIRARLIGAKAASGSVLIFIDSHCEAGTNWLPPLLQPIYDSYRTVTCPFIDVINENDFSINPQDEGARGAFDWNFDYKRLNRLEEDANHPEKPFASPVMAGGLFAISSKWFWELGGYDAGLEVWGGEQYELSFKIWMCGGTMVDIPCSRIAHVYRRFNPFHVPGMGDYLRRNYMRIAEVWMDDWKRYLYEKHPESFTDMDPGDLTNQKSLRNKLNCQSFDWFMKVVAFDLVKHYPPQEPVAISHGRFVSDADPRMCIDSKFGEQGDIVHMDKCMSDGDSKVNGEQNFEFTYRLDIRPNGRSVCFDYPGSGKVLALFTCHNQRGNQLWRYNLDTHQLLHVISNKCIDSKPQRSEIYMDECHKRVTQKWTLDGLNEEAARNQWS